MTPKPPGPEVVRRYDGSPIEAWIFWPNERDLCCQWPTAALAERTLEGHTLPHEARQIIQAYLHLVDHPAGTESAVSRLRALRRAERSIR